MIKPYFCNPENWSSFSKECSSWEGTPYYHLQMAKGFGADCTLFIAGVFLNVGIISKVDREYYSKDWFIVKDVPLIENAVVSNLRNNVVDSRLHFKEVLNVEGDFVRGDLLLITTERPIIANHIGILWDNGKMIHCINGRGVEFSFYGRWWQKHTKYKIRLFEGDGTWE